MSSKTKRPVIRRPEGQYDDPSNRTWYTYAAGSATFPYSPFVWNGKNPVQQQLVRSRYNSGRTWDAQRKSRTLAPAPYTMTKKEFVLKRKAQVSQYYTPAKSPIWAGTFVGAYTVYDAASVCDQKFGAYSNADVANRARSKFMNKLAGNDFHGAAFAAEFKETREQGIKLSNELFHRTMSHEEQMFNFMKRSLNKKFSSIRLAQRALKDVTRIVSSRWLEYSFGIKPLLGDIDDFAKAAAYSLELPPAQRMSVKDQQVYERSWTDDYSVPILGWVGKCHVTASRRIEVRYGCSKVLTPPLAEANRRRFGVSWEDILPGIYQGIPFSFLWDYFSNLGDIINAVSHLGRLAETSNRWGILVREDMVSWDCGVEGGIPGIQYSYQDAIGESGSTKFFQFTRLVDPNVVPLPQFYGFDEISSSNMKQYNIAALLGQLMTRESRSARLFYNRNINIV